MSKPINEHEGKKYLREIRSAANPAKSMFVDVYDVIEAFKVTCPGRQQAIKKLLMAGLRGKGSQLQDLVGADAALSRAIELQQQREGTGEMQFDPDSVRTVVFDDNLTKQVLDESIKKFGGTPIQVPHPDQKPTPLEPGENPTPKKGVVPPPDQYIHYAPYGLNARGEVLCGAKGSAGYTDMGRRVTCPACKKACPGLWPEEAEKSPDPTTGEQTTGKESVTTPEPTPAIPSAKSVPSIFSTMKLEELGNRCNALGQFDAAIEIEKRALNVGISKEEIDEADTWYDVIEMIKHKGGK